MSDSDASVLAREYADMANRLKKAEAEVARAKKELTRLCDDFAVMADNYRDDKASHERTEKERDEARTEVAKLREAIKEKNLRAYNNGLEDGLAEVAKLRADYDRACLTAASLVTERDEARAVGLADSADRWRARAENAALREALTHLLAVYEDTTGRTDTPATAKARAALATDGGTCK